MLIIGEKINGTRSDVARAITARDSEAVQVLAVHQVEAGALMLDVNAGTPPDQEPDDLAWLVDTVQRAVAVPLCLDSANPEALRKALGTAERTPMINSISGEPKRLNELLPLVTSCGCPVIALLLDKTGIPRTAVKRVKVAASILRATRDAGIADESVYIDPVTLSVASEASGAKTTLETMGAIRGHFPKTKLCVGLSNISYGLPHRSYINRAFLTLALYAGLDAAILNPLDDKLSITLLAAQSVLGKDKFGVSYIRSLRNRSSTVNEGDS